MAMASTSSDLTHDQKISRKKKVVNEMLALRRMKLRNQRDQKESRRTHSPNTGRVYEAFKVAHDEEDYHSNAPFSTEKVRGLLNGTSLEKELHNAYGEKALEDAAEHYVGIVTGENDSIGESKSRTKGFADVAHQRLFLHKLMKERKLKMEAMKQKRYEKEQDLLQQKSRLRLAKIKLHENEADNVGDIETDSGDENLNVLVNEVKRNIGGLEKHIKQLKRDYRPNAKRMIASKKPPAIDYEFKPWQEEQVQIATTVVNDIINRALDICVYSGDNLASTLLEALLQTDNEMWDKMAIKEMEHDAILDIIDEIENEVSSVFIQKTAEECAFLMKMIKVASCDLVINSSYTAVSSKPPKDTNDPFSSMIDKMWIDMATRRLKSRRNIWAHSQSVISKVAPSTTAVAVQPTESTEESESDVTPLSYEQTPPTQKSFSGEIWNAYIANELSYWESSAVNLISTPFNLTYKKIIAISCLSLSHDNQHLAVGTYAGDILVYDVTWEPFRPIRCVSHVGKITEMILQISWTLDKSRIISLSSTQCLIVWSISFPSPSSSSDLRHLGIPAERDDSYNCQQLTALCILEGQLGDFVIKEGSLSSSVSRSAFSNPITAKFFPAMNLAGAQNFIVVGFESGDILKCDLMLVMASRMCGLLNYQPQKTDSPYINGNSSLSKVSKIANGIDVELFRSHKNPITLIHFVKNNGDMITLDTKLNINVWKHDKEQLSGFNWFTPFRKLRLTGTETVMEPKSEERVLFEDEITLKKQVKGKKRKGKQIIEKERREAMSEIRVLQLQYRKPWHDNDDKDLDDNDQRNKKPGKFQTRTYAPTKQEIIDPMADQLFHTVTKQRSTNLLVRYTTRVYSVSSQTCRALVGMKPSSNGQKIYFMFLYGKHLPDIKAHVTFVDLDLNRLDMLQSVLIKLFMKQDEFDKCVRSKELAFTVTRKFLSTNTDNIYCSFAGRMHVLSTRTGSEVAWCAPDKRSKKDKPEHGLELPSKLCQVSGKRRLTALCPNGKRVYIILQMLPENKKGEALSGMFSITDNAGLASRQSLHFINKQMEESQAKSAFAQDEDTSKEQFVHTEKYSLREMPPELYIRMNLNAVIDNAVAIATGEMLTNEQRKKLWDKDWEQMQRQYFTNSA